MEGLDAILFLVFMVGGGMVVVVAFLALVALNRTTGIADLKKRIEGLERALARIDRQLSRAGAPQPATARDAAVDPTSAKARESAAAVDPTVASRGVPASATQEAAGERQPRTSFPPNLMGTTPGGGGTAPPHVPLPPSILEMNPGGGGGAPPHVPSPTLNIEWERWIGIRGAAVLGGAVLALAGLLLFQYSIQHGLITPTMRVVTGSIVGIACLVAAEWLRGRTYQFTPQALAGAGIVILYSSFWAAHALYALVGLGVCFGLLVLVTVVCCLLALVHESQIVAILGLVGGFATPIFLHSDTDRPIGLFSYVLLLDLGLLAIARNRRWAGLGILSLAGTVLMQALWIVVRMGPDQLLLGLAILAVFAVLFAATGEIIVSGESDRRLWLSSQGGAVLMPFAFALYFASRVDLGPHLYPVAGLLALLATAACWIGIRREAGLLAVGAAAGCAGVVGVWLVQHTLTPVLAWEVIAIALGLTTIFHLALEWRGKRGPESRSPAEAGSERSFAAILAVGVFFAELILAAAVSPDVPLWPWLAGWLGLAVLCYRHAEFEEREALPILGGLGLGVGVALYHLTQFTRAGFPGWTSFLAAAVMVSVLAQGHALLRRAPRLTPFSNHAAAVLPALLLVSFVLALVVSALDPAVILVAELVLGVLIALAATRLGGGPWYAVAAGLTALAHLAWTAGRFNFRDGQLSWVEARSMGEGLVSLPPMPPSSAGAASSAALVALGIGLLAAAFFTIWPFFAKGALARDRWSWYTAVLAAPAWFLALRRLFVVSFGDGFIGILPLVLAALALGCAFGTRSIWAAGEPMRRNVLAWFAAAALSFVSVAIPLQLSKEWITIGWALEGLAVIVLWKRLDHAGLKYYALALLAGATLRLIFNPAVLGYYPRSEIRIVNWLSYTYLVPVAALLVSAALLRGLEVARARDFERDLYEAGNPVASVGCTLAGIVTFFVWINLTIFDWFATGPALQLHLAHVPACDLTLSIAWAVYGLILLGFGMAGGSKALRWVSLSFLVLTIGKVFLYDLGELKDLYRVASLVGLAVSLLLVSLLYQRFVFRKKSEGAL